MDEFGLTHWIIFTLLPLIIAIYSILSKVSKEKINQAKNINDVKKDVKKHDEALKMIHMRLEKQNEEFKTLHKLEAQSDALLKMMNDLKEDIRQQNNNK